MILYFRITVLAFAFFTSPLVLHSQAILKVIDRDSLPIPYAMVTVESTVSRATDGSGKLILQNISSNNIDVAVRRIGYQPFSGSISRSNESESFIVVLHGTVRGLDTVRTVASQETPLSRTGFYDRMDRVQNGAITGEFISPEELEMRAPGMLSHVLRGRSSVTIARSTGARNKSVAMGRGGRCGMTVLLDGKRVHDMLEETSNANPTSLSPSGQYSGSSMDSGLKMGIDDIVGAGEIMAVEIYPSTANAPAELISLTGKGSCGIIAIWTGPRR